MDILKNVFVASTLNALDPTPVNAEREDFFLALLVCRDLTGLCELGVESLEIYRKDHLDQFHGKKQLLPDIDLLKMFQEVLLSFYTDEMFIIDEKDNKTLPNWNVIKTWPAQKLEYAYKIFRAIKNNIQKNPATNKMTESIEKRNKSYVIENFDILFKDVPFSDSLNRFKNFLLFDVMTVDQEDLLWAYFDNLMYFFNNEKEILKDLKK